MTATTKAIVPKFASDDLGLEEWTITTGTPTLYQGALICRNSSGVVVDPTETTGLRRFGTFVKMSDNNPSTKTQLIDGKLTSAANGTKILVSTKKRWVANGESIAETDIGSVAYCDDNQTAKTTSTGTSPMGLIEAVSSDDGVLVNFYPADQAIADAAVATAKIADGAVTTAKLAADAVDGTKLADNAVDSEHYTDGSIDPIHLASGYRNLAADAALTLAVSDRTIEVTATAGGAIAATMTTAGMATGQRITVRMRAGDGTNYYTFACDYNGSTGTVTLNAAAEFVELVYDGSAWNAILLSGATFA